MHLTATSAESRLLCVPLLQAERAWAHAMQLRQEANTEPRKKFHLVARLKKAYAHAQTLLQLCEVIFRDGCNILMRAITRAECLKSFMKALVFSTNSYWACVVCPTSIYREKNFVLVCASGNITHHAADYVIIYI